MGVAHLGANSKLLIQRSLEVATGTHTHSHTHTHTYTHIHIHTHIQIYIHTHTHTHHTHTHTYRYTHTLIFACYVILFERLHAYEDRNIKWQLNDFLHIFYYQKLRYTLISSFVCSQSNNLILSLSLSSFFLLTNSHTNTHTHTHTPIMQPIIKSS